MDITKHLQPYPFTDHVAILYYVHINTLVRTTNFLLQKKLYPSVFYKVDSVGLLRELRFFISVQSEEQHSQLILIDAAQM